MRLRRAKVLIVSIMAVICTAAPITAKASNAVHDPLVLTEIYIWNRLADFLEIFRMGVAVGPGIGAEVALTEYAQLGAYATSETGASFPHFLPPLWIVPHLDDGLVLQGHTGAYRRWSFGPWEGENTFARDVRFPRSRWEIRAQAAVVLAHLYASVDILEIGDFLAGFVCVDFQRDDQHPSPIARRTPCRQLGRGVSNVVAGLLVELPVNMIRVTKEDGHFAGATYGLLRGLWRGLIREGVGVVEIVTFPMGWKPMIEPEFPFEKEVFMDWRVNRPGWEKY